MAEGTLETNRIFIFSHFRLRFRQVTCFVQLYLFFFFPCLSYIHSDGPGFNFCRDTNFTNIMRQQSDGEYVSS